METERGRDAGAAGGAVVRRSAGNDRRPVLLDASIARSDVRTNTTTGVTREGVPLGLAFTVSQLAGGRCTPLPGAVVHIWQCDAVGIYSGVSDPGVAAGNLSDNALRGIQTTDARGRAAFTTLYPGWYRGRAVHIHFKIRTTAASAAYHTHRSSSSRNRSTTRSTRCRRMRATAAATR